MPLGARRKYSLWNRLDLLTNCLKAHSSFQIVVTTSSFVLKMNICTARRTFQLSTFYSVCLLIIAGPEGTSFTLVPSRSFWMGPLSASPVALNMWSCIVKFRKVTIFRFGSANVLSLWWLVNGPATACTCRKQCNKYGLSASQCFWLAHHNDRSRCFAISSPPPICCFSFMGGIAKK